MNQQQKERREKNNRQQALMNAESTKALNTRIEELVKNNDTKGLAYKYIDLENDFAYIVEINKTIADRFEAVFGIVPTSEEIQFLIDQEPTTKDLKRLTHFKSFLEAREKNNVNMKPKKYEEISEKEFKKFHEKERREKKNGIRLVEVI
jgi:hypothetical protein